mmetsp:Transcript_16477/g.44445  ORF Transcript_16477/g.44445 Transcript_16477/m.44445 type:complete len:222 (-) Transcript_16477:664-1329(-)
MSSAPSTTAAHTVGWRRMWAAPSSGATQFDKAVAAIILVPELTAAAADGASTRVARAPSRDWDAGTVLKSCARTPASTTRVRVTKATRRRVDRGQSDAARARAAKAASSPSEIATWSRRALTVCTAAALRTSAGRCSCTAPSSAAVHRAGASRSADANRSLGIAAMLRELPPSKLSSCPLLLPMTLSAGMEVGGVPGFAMSTVARSFARATAPPSCVELMT